MSSMTKQPEAKASTSITARLVAFYLVSTLLILLCTNYFQFKALSKDLAYEDNDFVVERIQILREIVTRHPDALKDQIPSGNAGEARHLIRVQDEQGRTLLQSPGMSELGVELFPPAVTADQSIGHSIKHRTPRGKQYLLNAAWAERRGDAHHRLVQVALDITDEDELMSKYLIRTGTAVLIGVFLAAALGVLIARRGLKPLQEMAGKVARITEAELHQRVRTANWPKELDQLTLALDGMLARLEESFARLSEFSANLAHELRTPINNLRGEAEVALSKARSEEEYRDIIASSVEEYERLSRMVGDILFLARPDQTHRPQPIDVRQEVETLAEYYRNVADEQQTVISIKGGGSASVDPQLFQRAVGNVISNALHYTPRCGRVSIDIRSNEDGGVEIAVADNGMGIDPAELPRIFDRFFRSPQARLIHNQGSGLGLAIVRSIMSLHGASVAVTSNPGEGTVVKLLFPPPAAPEPA